MKILVCTDGSEHSKKALREASVIAEGCNVNEVAIMNVFEPWSDVPFPYEGTTPEQIENFQKMKEEQKEERKKILSEASKFFKEKNLKTRTILKNGHPAQMIVNVAHEEKFDMIVIGSRGLGGLKKLFLGSVSNAIIQEIENCSVLVVK